MPSPSSLTSRPKPPQPRSSKTGTSTINNTDTTESKHGKEKSSGKPLGKPSLYARYNALSFKVKLYLWITTAGAAWLADSLSDRIFEQNMIDAEATRRVEMEIRKMRELEQVERGQK